MAIMALALPILLSVAGFLLGYGWSGLRGRPHLLVGRHIDGRDRILCRPAAEAVRLALLGIAALVSVAFGAAR
jgi:hypothetical protein